jgi:uncharacterized membrane protein
VTRRRSARSRQLALVDAREQERISRQRHQFAVRRLVAARRDLAWATLVSLVLCLAFVAQAIPALVTFSLHSGFSLVQAATVGTALALYFVEGWRRQARETLAARERGYGRVQREYDAAFALMQATEQQ